MSASPDAAKKAIEPLPGTIDYAWSRVQGSAYGAEVHLGQLLDWTRTAARGTGVSQHAVHLIGRRLIGEAYVTRGWVTEWKTIQEIGGAYSARHTRRVMRHLEGAGMATPSHQSGKPGKWAVHPKVILRLAQTGEKTVAEAEAARARSHLLSPASDPGFDPTEPGELPLWVPKPQPGSTVTRAEMYAAFVEIARILGGDAVADLRDEELGGAKRRIHKIWATAYNFCPLPRLVEDIRRVTSAYLGGAGGVAWANLRAKGKLPECLLTVAYWHQNVKTAAAWHARGDADQDARGIILEAHGRGLSIDEIASETGYVRKDVMDWMILLGLKANPTPQAGLLAAEPIDLEGPAAEQDVDLFFERVWCQYARGTSLEWVCQVIRALRVEDGAYVLGVPLLEWDRVTAAATLDEQRELARAIGAVRLEPER